nr:hypothetical protein Iba_chr01bCG1220 [Ipomoea batatas]
MRAEGQSPLSLTLPPSSLAASTGRLSPSVAAERPLPTSNREGGPSSSSSASTAATNSPAEHRRRGALPAAAYERRRGEPVLAAGSSAAQNLPLLITLKEVTCKRPNTGGPLRKFSGQTAQGPLRPANFHLLLAGKETPACGADKANHPHPSCSCMMHGRPMTLPCTANHTKLAETSAKTAIDHQDASIDSVGRQTPDITSLSNPNAANTPELEHPHNGRQVPSDTRMAPPYSFGAQTGKLKPSWKIFMLLMKGRWIIFGAARGGAER